MNECKSIYPLKIIRPLKDCHLINNQTHFQTTVDDIIDNNCVITDFIGDNPKRAIARHALNHASNYACEYCTGKAIQYSHKSSIGNDAAIDQKYELQRKAITTQIDLIKNTPGSSKKKLEDDKKIEEITRILQDIKNNYKKSESRSHVVWPSSSANSSDRQLSDILTIVELIEENNVNQTQEPSQKKRKLNPDILQGITGRSVLLNVPHFDFLSSIPTEYMHSLCIGVVRRMLELTFKVGENRHRNTKRKLTPPSTYKSFMKTVKVPREFSRRGRNLDLAVLKGQEKRNILLFFSQLFFCPYQMK